MHNNGPTSKKRPTYHEEIGHAIEASTNAMGIPPLSGSIRKAIIFLATADGLARSYGSHLAIDIKTELSDKGHCKLSFSFDDLE